MPNIVPIVEGKAEVEAVPVLLRRILSTDPDWNDVGVVRPYLVKRSRVVKPGELERTVKQALSDRVTPGGVLIILDADDDLACNLGPSLLNRAIRVTKLPVSVVLACREFEAWFLGAKESLRGAREISADATIPRDPESIRGAKERLSKNMVGHRYVEVDDQPAFVSTMDLDMAQQNCPSFARLLRETERLVREIQSQDAQ